MAEQTSKEWLQEIISTLNSVSEPINMTNTLSALTGCVILGKVIDQRGEGVCLLTPDGQEINVIEAGKGDILLEHCEHTENAPITVFDLVEYLESLADLDEPAYVLTTYFFSAISAWKSGDLEKFIEDPMGFMR